MPPQRHAAAGESTQAQALANQPVIMADRGEEPHHHHHGNHEPPAEKGRGSGRYGIVHIARLHVRIQRRRHRVARGVIGRARGRTRDARGPQRLRQNHRHTPDQWARVRAFHRHAHRARVHRRPRGRPCAARIIRARGGQCVPESQNPVFPRAVDRRTRIPVRKRRHARAADPRTRAAGGGALRDCRPARPLTSSARNPHASRCVAGSASNSRAV